MESQSSRFLVLFWCAVVLVTLGLGAFDVVVDPYALFTSPNWFHSSMSGTREMATVNERMTKSYDVLRKTPSALILGTSSVDVGLDARSSAWPQNIGPVYNLGIFSIDLQGMYQYLRHVVQVRSIDMVVIGIDFDQFLGRWVHPLATEDQFRLDRRSLSVSTPDLLRSAFSFDAFADSINFLANELIGEHPRYISGNRPEDDFVRFKVREGPTAFFRITDIRDISVVALKPASKSQIDDLRAIINLCLSNNVRVIVVINPVHVNLLETYSLSGYWNGFEDWKRELVAMTTQSAGDPVHPGRVELWDFAEYDRYSTVDLPRATDWFWDSNHYTRQLGDRALRRLFGDGEPGFGVRLTAETLESDLQTTRERQLQYRQTHLTAVNALKQLYEETPH